MNELQEQLAQSRGGFTTQEKYAVKELMVLFAISLRSSAKNTGILQVDSPDRLSPPSTSILKVEVTVVP